MRRRGAALLMLSSLLFLGACVDSNGREAFPIREPAATPSSDTGPVIGLVGTMTGPDARRGTDAFEGADLAVHALNQGRASGALPFELVTLDDEGDPESATMMVEDLAASERTVGIIYAGPLEGLPPAEAALAQAGIPAVVVFGDLFTPALLREHLFQVSPPFEWQARRLAAYFRGDRRYRKVGLMAERSLDGDTAIGAMRNAMRTVGGRLTVTRYDPSEPLSADVLDPLEKKVEAILVQGRGEALGQVIDHLKAEGSLYRSTAAARIPRQVENRAKARRLRQRPWRPQLGAFDGAFVPLDPSEAKEIPAGTVITESYSRGAHYLPVESFKRFDSSFRNWWDSDPIGWQRRGYEAAAALGWAARRADPGTDVAGVLETLSRVRFGGTTFTFGPEDHVAPEPATVGIWVKPRPGIGVRERGEIPPGLPWVPLARGFSSDGVSTDIESADWSALFEGPFKAGRAPSVTRARYGVATPRRDPVH